MVKGDTVTTVSYTSGLLWEPYLIAHSDLEYGAQRRRLFSMTRVPKAVSLLTFLIMQPMLTNCKSVCDSAWSHDSFSEIAWFIVTAVCSLLFASVAFSYYRQMLDPTSPANASRAPSAQARAGLYPEHYNPPYAGDGGFGAGAVGQYAPPPGPPPAASSTAYVPEYDPVKLPEYESKGGYTAGAHGDDKDGDPFADFTREGHAEGDAARRV